MGLRGLYFWVSETALCKRIAVVHPININLGLVTTRAYIRDGTCNKKLLCLLCEAIFFVKHFEIGEFFKIVQGVDIAMQ